MYTYVATAILSAAIAATGAWKVQAWRWGAADAERLALEAKGAEQTRAAERRQHVDVLEAVNASKRREQTARVAAVGARNERDGLRDDLAAAQQLLSSAAPGACIDRSTAISGLLDQCAAALEDMAGKAQRHANDAVMLREAWPQ